MRNALFLSAGLAGILALGAATDASAELRLLGDGPQVELRDLVARVVVTPEERSDVDIRVRYGKVKVPTLMVSKRGNTTVLNGHLKAPDHGMSFNFRINIGNDEQGTVVIPGMGAVNVADLPLVLVRVPMNASVKDSAFSFGHIGASKSLDFVMNGSGDWLVDPVNGPLNVISTGSGDIRLTTAGDTIIDNMGAGDISIDAAQRLQVSLTGSGGFTADHSADTVIENHGSGDVAFGRVSSMRVKLNGSGDADLGTVNGPLSIDNNGSSDVHVVRVSGPIQLDLTGSGDVDIEGGQTPSFIMVGSGSGDVSFGGTTGTVNIDSNGSSDISINKATGGVVSKVNGSGETHIGH